ncbi:MAG: RNA-binding protein [Rhizobiaceae bacterium]
MNDRTCIVTRQSGDRDRLIRFVAGPDGAVVPDLKQTLPGRGCWVTGTRANVDIAARKNLFARALRAKVTADGDLGALVDALLAKSALGSIGLARKAGEVALGATKVEAAIRKGAAVAVLHAVEASDDGVRKMDQARRAVLSVGGPEIAAAKLFREDEMSLALGGTNVIHAALLAGPAGKAALKRVAALLEYRRNSGADRG